MNALPENTRLITSIGRLIHLWPHPNEYDDIIALGGDRGTVGIERGDGEAIYIFTDVTPGRSAEAMIYILDKASMGKDKDPLHMEVVNWVFKEYELKRLQSVVPMPMIQARRFSERIGFQHEGILRNYGIMNGQLCDSWIGSMVK